MVCPFNGRSLFKEAYKDPAQDIARRKDTGGLLDLFASRTAEVNQNEFFMTIYNQHEREASSRYQWRPLLV